MKTPKGQAKAVSKDIGRKATKATPIRGRVKVPPLRPAGTGGKPNDITWHKAFIKALGATANVAAACRAVKVSRNIAYEHKVKFDDFRLAWEEAEGFALDTLYTIGLKHATLGTIRPVFQQGRKVGSVTEYDHRLLEWLLERKRPSEFSSKHKLELSGKITMTDEEIEAASKENHSSLLLTMAGGLKGEK